MRGPEISVEYFSPHGAPAWEIFIHVSSSGRDQEDTSLITLTKGCQLKIKFEPLSPQGYYMGPILGGGIKQYKSSNLYGSFAGFLLNNNALFGARCHIVTDPWLVTFLYGLFGL